MTDTTPLPSSSEIESEAVLADVEHEDEFVEVKFEADLTELSPTQRARLDRLGEWAPGYISARIREILEAGKT
ncbi:hypothetical protein [Nocardia sienata]|uniref:hypothetical protein n=1 Tax=Nocardia sienata TaxID=248552 RepID=UPI0007A49966|nr:hypothetical protein [Nocardia sienata]